MFKIQNLTKTFNGITVLNNINLVVKEGERIVIIGPSGSGKSTFLRCLNTLEKPTSGKILFEGINVQSQKFNKREIGMVFQNFNLFKNLTVLENITLAPIANKLFNKEEAIKKGRQYLDDIGLGEKEKSYPADLSGGQQQRVAIIRSLMMQPKVILFDEPTSALDAEMIDEVLNLMQKVANQGMTLIVVTHELNFAKNFATRIIFMDKGKIIEEGPPNKIFNNPSTERLREFLNI